MENSKEAIKAFDGEQSIGTLEPLELITKLGRVSRLISPQSDRKLLSLSTVKSASTIYNLILSTIIKMWNIDNDIILDSTKELLMSLKEQLQLMLDRGIEEFDYGVITEMFATYRVAESQVKIIIGRWYVKHDLGPDIETGSYDQILRSIIETCFINMEFLGV